MKCLALDTEGHLVIPTADEISKARLVPLHEDRHRRFSTWRLEFPRVEAATPEKSKQPDPSKQTEANNTLGKIPEPDTQVTNEAELKENVGD